MTSPPPALAAFLSERERLTRNGWEEGAHLRLSDLLSEAVIDLAGSVPDGVAVIATGGFGRGVMALQSDVDLLFLHEGPEPEATIRGVLRPLWDAKLKVGHLTHTPKGARVFAGTRLDAVSTFLSARLLSGSEEVFDDFRRRFTGLLEKEHARIVSGMADEERRRRAEEPYRLMAADLKTGRGGIRTVDMIDWRRRLLAAHRAPTPTQDPAENEARVELTVARSALHAAAGRAHDTYDFELREAAARWLGTDVVTLGRRILRARSTAERLVDTLWPEVAPAATAPGADLLAMTEPSASARWLRAIRDGVFDDTVPDLGRMVDEPHVVPFHRHPVGEHTMAACHRAHELLEEDEDPIVREVVAASPRPELLVWGALLHDVGKGLGGDHARQGAARVDVLGPRLGLDDQALGVVRRLVEHHLLLADLATKLDADDPAVRSWVADRLGDVETLRLLYLLTAADSRATGSDTWSPWRAELARRAYRRLEREFARRSMPEGVRVELMADSILALEGETLERDEVVAHLAGFGEVYRTAHSADEIRAHIMLARRPLGPGGALVSFTDGSPARLVLIAADRPRLLLDVAGVLAVNRLSIIDARFATRSDGRVFDTFEVVGASGEAVLDAERRTKTEAELVRVLRGGFDFGDALSEKRRAYRDTGRTGVEPKVDIRRTDDGAGVVEVECADRLGLLYDLGVVFDRYGMPITRARVDTRSGVAYDTFFVSRLPADTAGLHSDLVEATS